MNFNNYYHNVSDHHNHLDQPHDDDQHTHYDNHDQHHHRDGHDDDDDQLRCLFSVPFHPRAETILGPEFETNQITPTCSASSTSSAHHQ